MIIQVTVILMIVFWPVCTQISITKCNLNCAIQVMVRRCFAVTHLSNHTVKSSCECLDLKIVILLLLLLFFFFFGGGRAM